MDFSIFSLLVTSFCSLTSTMNTLWCAHSGSVLIVDKSEVEIWIFLTILLRMLHYKPMPQRAEESALE